MAEQTGTILFLGYTLAVAPVTGVGQVFEFSHMFFVYVLVKSIALAIVTEISTGIVLRANIYRLGYFMAHTANNPVFMNIVYLHTPASVVRENFISMTNATAFCMWGYRVAGVTIGVACINSILYLRNSRRMAETAVIVVSIQKVALVTDGADRVV